MAEPFAINVDFARVRRDGKTISLMAWGDPVQVVSRTADEITVELPDWEEQADGSFKRVMVTGTLKRKIRVGGVDHEVALPVDEVPVLKVSFVDVQQGDGTLIQTPKGRLITLDAGMNQLFARFLASRFPDTSKTNRRTIDAMIVSHGDADHYSGLTQISKTETETKLAKDKRIFVHPARVFHNGLVRRGDLGLESFGATVTSGSDVVVTDLASDLLAVPESAMNTPMKAWRKALAKWAQNGQIEFRRLARGPTDAFDFLKDERITVEVLGPLETTVGDQVGLKFLPAPKDGVPLDHLDFQPGALSASHTINGHSIVLRLRYGNIRMLFAGDLNNAAEEQLVAEHKARRVNLRAEVFKTPHHGSHEFTPAFLKAVAPIVSVVSSGDENARSEHIHPRATLMNALGRFSRTDAGIVFVTEMVAFFQTVGWSISTAKQKIGSPPPTPFFGFKRTAFGCVRVRTDGRRVLVFTDSGKRDLKEIYAYEAERLGAMEPATIRRA